MKVLIAIDSFKGSLSSFEAGRAVENGIRRADKTIETAVFPIADGGEGTVDALIYGKGGSLIETYALDPLGRKIKCRYGITKDNTAVMEMSACSGLTLLKADELDPTVTTTYGVGQMICDAIDRGCRRFIIGIGGSATNDGGAGMLEALGFGLLDKNGKQIRRGAVGLKDICSIADENTVKALKECEFLICCDVKNPLCGKNGASFVYAPQKGADAKNVELMDGWLSHYADLVEKKYKNADRNTEGAGAAGGLGFAFVSFLNGRLVSGIDTVLSEIGIEEKINEADIVVTGEGRLDGQTVMGKVPVGIARLAKKYGKTVIALSGCVTKDAGICNENGIDAFFPILRTPCSLSDALDKTNAENNASDTAEQIFRLIKRIQ